jgi:hypothetical protein
MRYLAPSTSRSAMVPRVKWNDIMTRRTSMRSLIRPAVLAISVLVASAGIPGCSTDENNAGKMESGKPGGAMDKMQPGKMGGAMDKMEPGKTGGAMDKMEPGKMGGAMDKGKME